MLLNRSRRMSPPNLIVWRPRDQDMESAYWNVLFARACGKVKTSIPTGLKPWICNSPIGPVVDGINSVVLSGSVTSSFEEREMVRGDSLELSNASLVRPNEKRAWL